MVLSSGFRTFIRVLELLGGFSAEADGVETLNPKPTTRDERELKQTSLS